MPVKESDAGVSDNGDVPVPAKAAVTDVRPVAPTVRVAASAPTEAGLNVTVNVQVPLITSAAVQPFATENEVAPVPLNAFVTAPAERAVVVVTVMACVAAATPICVAP